MFDLFLTFIVGVVASIVSGIAGGGGGLISAPFFILLGLPPQVAVATTKFGALGLTIGSVARFSGTTHIKTTFVVFLSILSIAAAIIGSRLLLTTSSEMIQRLVGGTMLISLPFVFVQDIGSYSFKPSYWKEATGYVLYFCVLVLQAAFGAGVGISLMLVMTGLLGFTALEANATRRIPGFLLAVLSLGIYMIYGVVYYSYGIAMLAGMLIGGYIGTHIAIQKGNRFVKAAFAGVVVLLAVRLLV